MTDHAAASVVIPVFNRAGRITAALDSIAAQTRPPAAVICVDDCSTDDSAGVIARWASARPDVPLALIRQSANTGPAGARNAGIRAAKTDRIAFLDSDDLWLPHAHDTLVALADAHPDAVLVAGEARVIADGAPRSRDLLAPYLDRLAPGAVRAGALDGAQLLTDPMAALLTTSFLPTSASLFDRACAIDAGLMPDFRMGEDWLFFLALAQRGDVVVTRDIIAVHHRHADNSTSPDAGARIAAEHLRGLDALLDGTLPIVVPDALRPRLEAAATACAADWRWHTARRGWSAYRTALSSPVGRRRGGSRQLLTDPRCALRAMLS